MQRHAEEGARIIDRLGFLNDAVPAIRHHHERFDGTGYPDRLQGEDIPLGARIIHVADALDSMLTTRIYRAARPAAEALAGAPAGGRHPVLPALRRRARADPAAREPRARATARAARRRRFVDAAARAAACVLSRIALPFLAWPASRAYRAVAKIDPDALASFQAGIRKRYSRRADPRRAARVRGAARPLADDARVRGRPGDERAPADGDRALRQLERREARGRARPAPVRDARGAASGCCASWARSSAARRRPGPRRAPRARCRRSRSTGTRSARSTNALREAGLRRAGGGGAARARGRAGRRARAAARPAAEVRRLGARRARRTPTLLTEWQVYRMFDVAPRRVVDVPVPGPRAPASSEGVERRRRGRDAWRR